MTEEITARHKIGVKNVIWEIVKTLAMWPWMEETRDLRDNIPVTRGDNSTATSIRDQECPNTVQFTRVRWCEHTARQLAWHAPSGLHRRGLGCTPCHNGIKRGTCDVTWFRFGCDMICCAKDPLPPKNILLNKNINKDDHADDEWSVHLYVLFFFSHKNTNYSVGIINTKLVRYRNIGKII